MTQQSSVNPEGFYLPSAKTQKNLTGNLVPPASVRMRRSIKEAVADIGSMQVFVYLVAKSKVFNTYPISM